VEVISGPDSIAEDLTFKWNVTAEDKRNMDIQMYFDNPIAVSANPVS
jgi:hypothetical protein